jgi:hypothetical protein
MELPLAVIGHQFNLVNLALQHIKNRLNRRGRRRRRVWVRPWISRRLDFGLYDQLLVELRNEDQIIKLVLKKILNWLRFLVFIT